MRRILIWIVSLVLLLFPMCRAAAREYADAEDLLVLEIPNDDSILYYADEDAQVPDDMQELAVSSGLDARLLLRSYTPQDTLGYTLDVFTCPLASLEPTSAERAPGMEHAAAARSFTDITADRNLSDAAIALARSMYEDRFRLASARSGSFAGVPDLEIQGTGLQDSQWAGYSCRILLLTNDERLLVIAAVYQDSEDLAMQSAAEKVLDGISLGETEAEPALSVTEQTTVPTAASPAQTVRVTASFEATAPPTASTGWLQTWRSLWDQHPNLPFYLLLGAAVLLLIIGLVVYIRAARKQRWTLVDDDDIRIEMHSPDTRRSRRQGTRKNRLKEEIMVASDRPAGNGRREYDYTEDISRYTQQPSADVNDVSRYTHGYDDQDSLSSELQALQDEPLEPKPIKIPSVGSRVERNRRKKRK